MGPIHNLWGGEQGGKNSGEFYKVYNNEQLRILQESELGVPLLGADPIIISAVAQADDICLISNNIFSLHCLQLLSLTYCSNYNIALRADKTILQTFSNKVTWEQAYYDSVVSPIEINEDKIEFSNETEHVGGIRSINGNLPHILQRFASH